MLPNAGPHGRSPPEKIAMVGAQVVRARVDKTEAGLSAVGFRLRPRSLNDLAQPVNKSTPNPAFDPRAARTRLGALP
jgi:hypothetical protein